MAKGFFITFEGGEGVGKTTQISRLSSALMGRGIPVITTREPGGTKEAEAVRALLSDAELGERWLPDAEAMLISAGRVMHVRTLIAPALESGKTVLCDRYTDSTRVYQGYVQNLPSVFIDILIERSTGGITPDLTFILDLPAEEGLKRVRARGVRDHYDKQDAAFYERIRQGFLEIAQEHPERCEVIDARQDADKVAAQILSLCLKRMNDV